MTRRTSDRVFRCFPWAIIHGFLITTLAITWILTPVTSAKVLDLNDNLPDLIEKHPDKNWLVEFYAPWCHHCQQLETTYHNVAESVYHRHDNLIVGRVDCTKTGRICEQYGVNSYPTITFINQNSQVNYEGDRSQESILAFASRLQGPSVNIVDGCRELEDAKNKHGLVILSTITNTGDVIRKEFESLASAYKAKYWFYQYDGSCKDLISERGLYLLKRSLDAAIKFEPPAGMSDNDLENNNNIKTAIVEWLNMESFPIYGRVAPGNIQKMLATKKLLIIAILDEYKPARRLTATSKQFSMEFEKMARVNAHMHTDVLFGWTSDIDLIEHITISRVEPVPNVMLLRPDFSYHLMLSNHGVTEQAEKDVNEVNGELLKKLETSLIASLIDNARANKLVFSGGSSYIHALMRYSIGNIYKFLNMYRANPLLVSVIFGFPSLIIVLVIYTTCFYEGRDTDEEDEGYSEDEYGDEDENRRLLDNGHLKQD